jgi:hypothetical protein
VRAAGGASGGGGGSGRSGYIEEAAAQVRCRRWEAAALEIALAAAVGAATARRRR